MPPRRGLAFLGCLAAALAACGSPHHRGGPPLSNEIDEQRYREDVRMLASDEFDGRKPGTGGEDKTVAFISAQFRRAGLKPASGETYVQAVPLVEIRPGADAALSFQGGRGALLPLGYGSDMVVFSPRAMPAASLAQSDLLFVGYGIVAPEYHWNDYAGADVRGKTVLVLLGDPGYGSRNPGVFKGLSMSAYGNWSYKVAEAARQGAAGVLLIFDQGLAGFGWSAVRNTWTGAQLESPAVADGAATPLIEGWLTGEAGRGLFAQAGLDFGAIQSAAARPGFKPVATGLKVSAEVHSTVRRFNSSNLVGIVPGSGGRHEYVVYTTHWDGLGRDSGGAILAGAEDNASGVAGLLVLAQSFARTRPPAERSAAFIVFTGGESGLLGSRYYVENPVIPLDQMAGVINLDELHLGGPTRDVIVYGAGNSELEDMARAAALLQGREVRPEPHPEQGLYYTSDEINFATHGVPALFFKAGIDDSARGPDYGLAQLDDYRARRFRQPGDKYSDDWKVGGAIEDLRLYYQVGEHLASTRRFPRWYPDSEFSAGHVRAAAGD
jgi:Zn-dependent M28 family amino/carboxypeptidase